MLDANMGAPTGDFRPQVRLLVEVLGLCGRSQPLQLNSLGRAHGPALFWATDGNSSMTALMPWGQWASPFSWNKSHFLSLAQPIWHHPGLCILEGSVLQRQWWGKRLKEETSEKTYSFKK